MLPLFHSTYFQALGVPQGSDRLHHTDVGLIRLAWRHRLLVAGGCHQGHDPIQPRELPTYPSGRRPDSCPGLLSVHGQRQRVDPQLTHPVHP